MALFALSPLFFAGIATRAFVPPAGAGASDGLLDVPAFATFLALVTGGVALFAALTYKRFPVPALLADDVQVGPAETTPLLAAPDAEHGAVPRPSNKAPHAHPATLRALAQTTDFWLLAVFCVLILGAVRASLLHTPHNSHPHTSRQRWSSRTSARSSRRSHI